MTRGVFVVDTNIVVSGMTSADPHNPPSRILDAMLDGRLLYLMSGALLSEYSGVLRRPGVARCHQQTEDEIDSLLTDLAANAVWREPGKSEAAPEPGDNHLWALLASQPGCQLITGDRLLLENPPRSGSVITPRDALAGAE
ncbi:MAG: PIN domain-containing protein [Gammaproteobacteria bacterium]|nr:PIN domain-containing protein [Gammaproteobacteria bacterium]MDE0257983.1 PIN domain-containing protein [Gammaproteobacteria bacterium]